MSETFQPLEDRVLIKPIDKRKKAVFVDELTGKEVVQKVIEDEKTDGGIIIPNSARKEVLEGIVFAVGEGRFALENGAFIPNILRKGDVVLCGTSAGMPLTVPDENGEKIEMRLMRESDVLLLIKKSS